jgi:hypothetical protein
MGYLSDPELAAMMEKGTQGFLGSDSAEFIVAFLEELGVRLTEEQKSKLEIASIGRRAPAGEDPGSSAVDQALAELRSTRELVDQLKTILSPDQEKLIFPLLGRGFSNGSTVALSAPGREEAASAVLDAWSKNILPLSDPERVLLAGTAAAYADRLERTQALLVARYGADVTGLLTHPSEMTITAGKSAVPPTSGSPESEATGFDAHRMTDLFDVYEQLLDLDSQERQALVALLPARADEIRKAAPVLLVMSPKK